MKSRQISYEEFQQLGKKYYCQGGDVIVECWDKSDFDEYCEMFGPMTERGAMNMIGLYESDEQESETFRKWASGEPEGGWNDCAEDPDPIFEEFCEWYDSINGHGETDRSSYSPSAPWNAPGMSVHDFI